MEYEQQDIELLDRNAESMNYKIKRNKLQLRILAIVLSTIFVLISCFVVLGMLSENVYIYTGIEGPSMKPTINAEAPNNGEPYDYAYVNTYQKGTYGDIIVIKHTSQDGVTKYVIKRLIGMEGDTVTIDNTGTYTKLYVNDVLIDEPYLSEDNLKYDGIGNESKSKTGVTSITLQKGKIFYMGDNRRESSDCRNYSYTSVPNCESVDNIIGRVDYIIPHEEVENGDGKGVERFFNGIKEIILSIF